MKNRFLRKTLGQFEYELKNILYSNRVGFLTDVTNDLKKDSDLWEHVYSISTKNPAVDIIVFSSVDIRTKKFRECDSDRVRLVMRWRTKKGYIYKRIARHNRIETLFDNVKNSIIGAQSEVFALKFAEFNPTMEV